VTDCRRQTDRHVDYIFTSRIIYSARVNQFRRKQELRSGSLLAVHKMYRDRYCCKQNVRSRRSSRETCVSRRARPSRVPQQMDIRDFPATYSTTGQRELTRLSRMDRATKSLQWGTSVLSARSNIRISIASSIQLPAMPTTLARLLTVSVLLKSLCYVSKL